LFLAFFKGTELTPVPDHTSKQASVRYLHIDEPGVFDEARFTERVKQESVLPGETI
jgi:hypothetical protein